MSSLITSGRQPVLDQPNYVIRRMTPHDLDTVNRIDRDAFETYRRQQGQITRSLRLRTVDNMLAALHRPFPGVVVEWPPDQIAGYCFTHVWGSVGWLGTLGVAPRRQGMGLGRAVIAAGLDLLREAGCHTLALETMPESGKNLALYTRLGLDSRQLTLLCKGTPRLAFETHFDIWSDNDDTLRQVAGRLVPGLDPTPAAAWLIEEHAGHTLVWREAGQPVAFAVLRIAPRRDGIVQSYLTVEAAACLPEVAAHWPRYLSEIQAFARRQARLGVVLPVNARQTGFLRATLDAGLQIVHSRVRMAVGVELGAPDDVLMLTLAM
jgi:ribosomal protein S18 acetylase RimI-like enzyme